MTRNDDLLRRLFELLKQIALNKNHHAPSCLVRFLATPVHASTLSRYLTVFPRAKREYGTAALVILAIPLTTVCMLSIASRLAVSFASSRFLSPPKTEFTAMQCNMTRNSTGAWYIGWTAVTRARYAVSPVTNAQPVPAMHIANEAIKMMR